MSLSSILEETGSNSSGSRTKLRISATRQQVDNRFPTLGFTVDARGYDGYEVVLATAPELLEDAARDRRTPSNYYSSAEHSGAIAPATDLYLVPAAVLPRFAGATRLYYLAVGRAGSERVASHAVADAPFVSLAPGFAGKSLGSALSISLEKLQRVRDDGQVASSGLAWPLQAALDPGDDAAESEDGYGLPANAAAAALDSDSVDFPDEPLSAAETEELAEYSDDAEATSAELEEYPADPEPSGDAAEALDTAYDDGFGPAQSSCGCSCPPHAGADSYDEARAFDSTFPAGAQPPTVLEDEEQEESERSPETSAAEGLESYAGSYGEETTPAALAEETPPADSDLPAYEPLDAASTAMSGPPLTVADKLRIMNQIAPFESGSAGYAAINADGEFEGRFSGHPATGRYHVGLSYGFVQFTQDSGSLGRLLQLMRARDAAKFRAVFGPDSDTLVTVLTAAGPASKDTPAGRSARVQPVGGADVWREPWASRFREAARPDLFGAGNPQLFNGAQNQLAAEMYLDPMLPFAKHMSLNTDRALAMVFDRAVAMGIGGARRWIVETVCPITAAQRQQALQVLGHADIQAFQRATRDGLVADGNWGPQTHAALVGALRAAGSRSPIPIPQPAQMLDAMVRGARGRRWERRVNSLRTSTNFRDTEFQL